MLNNKTKSVFMLILVLVVSLLFMFSIIIKDNRIDSIENYESIFASVDELQFFNMGNNFYGTKSPSKELKEIKKVKINSEPIATESRAFEYRIAVDDEYIIYISEDFSRLWIDDKSSVNISLDKGSFNKLVDDGMEASQLYKVENPEVLRNLFEEHS